MIAAPSRYAAGLALMWSVAALMPGEACSVPVFRYALDRWPADRYRLEVPVDTLRNGPLASEFRNLGSGSPLNLDAVAVPTGLGRLLFPVRERQSDIEAWTGSLTPDGFARLTDSPARRDLVERLLNGASAVWVLVESGEAALDDVAHRLVEARLGFLESAIGLPPIDRDDPASKIGPGPSLRVDLGLLRVRRDAPDEACFVRQLAGPVGLGALPDRAPFAALVFGRGRVLGVWPGAALTEELIEEATRFLIGSCSCEVKNLNPGWDLLLRVDWEKGLSEAEQKRIAGQGPVDGSVKPSGASASLAPETVTFLPKGTNDSQAGLGSTPESGSSDAKRPWILVGVGAVILLVALRGVPHLRS